VTRVVVAFVAGAVTAVLAAVTVGEYPLSAADIWLAAVIVPALLGAIMSAIGRSGRLMWFAAGPVAGGAIGWGIGISTSWGIEPVPFDAWIALAAATVWPVVWSRVMVDRAREMVPAAGAAEQQRAEGSSANGELGDSGLVGRPEIGDP
jgi:hypothetical protein